MGNNESTLTKSKESEQQLATGRKQGIYEFISPEEVLKRYPGLCGRALLYRLLSANKFPGVIKMGKLYRISVRALENAFNAGWSPDQNN